MSASSKSSASNRWLDLIASDPRACWMIGGVFFATALSLAIGRVYQHDEGALTYDLARAVWHEPAAVAFYLKAKISLLVVYALPAKLGFTAFLAVHAMLGAAAIVLVTKAARSLGVRYANLAGLVLALSPEFLVASSNGYANSSGAFFLALALFLLARRSRFGLGLLIGALPFARFELATIGLGLLALDLWRHRDLRALLGAAVVPALYTAAGAAYHGSLLWIFQALPDASSMPEAIAARRDFGDGGGVGDLARYLSASAAANLGGLGLLAVAGWRPHDRPWQALFLLAWVALGALVMVHAVGALGFDASARYHTAYLPILALLAAEGFARTELTPWLLVAVAAALSGFAPTAQVVVIIGLTGFAALAANAPEPVRAPVRLLFMGASLAALVTTLSGTPFERAQHQRVHQRVEQLRQWGWSDSEPLYTGDYIIRFEEHAGVVEAYTLANAAIVWELDRYANRANGQHAALTRAFEALGLYIAPALLRARPGALYVVEDDPRSLHWQRRLAELGLEERRLGRLKLYRLGARATP